jgi:hypothetical protein
MNWHRGHGGISSAHAIPYSPAILKGEICSF